MLKTSGKKNKKAIIIIVLLATFAAVLLTRPGIFRDLKDATSGKKPAPEKITVPAVPKPTKPASKAVKPPEKLLVKLAIIIDDVGYHTPIIDEYRKFEGKLTFSVLPFQPESFNYAQKIHRAGFEVMVHIPMEPENYPVKKPGKGALFVDDSRDEVELKLEKMMYNIPYASGANNHMGSMATQDLTLMTNTLSYLKSEGFYFIDSLTTPHSTAYEVAQTLQMQCGSRDIFLDNHNDFSSIEEQFEKLKSTARERGTAIGIGHIQNKNLLSVLNRQVITLKEEGIELVFVSELLRN